MFTSARIKLTTWYLLIIMTISLSFSVILYNGVRVELQRRFLQIENRLNLNPLGRNTRGQVLATLFQDYNEARARVIIILAYANGAIFVISAGAGYYLAGKTLQPIESALEEQKRFVADASHELRTPLTALQTSIEVTLRDKNLNLKDAIKTLKESLDDVQNLQSLTNNLLLLARSQETTTSETKNPIKLKPFLLGIVKQLTPIAEKRKLSIRVKTINTTISGNPDTLQQLFTILIDNAIKYSKSKGKILITSSLSRNYVKISVADSGIGIAKKDLPLIFNRFYRADTARTKFNNNGYGLGLCLAKRIVENHGGKISVTSTLGKGSTFTIKLPK